MGMSGLAAPSASAATPSTTAIVGNHSRAADTAAVTAAVPASVAQTFKVALNPRDPAGVAAVAKAVSNPADPQFHHYLTAAQWEARFSPTAATVGRVSSWLRSKGFTVGTVSGDRMSIGAAGTTGQVRSAFGVTVNRYNVAGKNVQLAANDAVIPTAFAGVISGVLGLDDSYSKPASTNGADTTTTTTTAASSSSAATPDRTAQAPAAAIQPPAGFRNSTQCSRYYGQKTANVPAYGGGYPASLPLSVCGYVPQQLQSAYSLSADYKAGITGAGQTVAIVDAYASPTLLSDTQTYYGRNDPAQQLKSANFATLAPTTFTNQDLCAAPGWYGEQALDVQAVHATAPGANILYVGATSCLDQDLLSAVQTVVDNGLAQVITNSYGNGAGDLLSSDASRQAEDTVLQMAATTGISVLFSSGDNGDEFASTGLASPDYPASSPYGTAVGGTSLGVAANGTQSLQVGWSTSKSTLCNADAIAVSAACKSATPGTYSPPAPGSYLYGAGGGTSYKYAQPYYQANLVPAPLANRNAQVTGGAGRVVPDISMNADPTTGMLIGLTQTFPEGVYYDQYRIGGTSLSSPLLAGVVALANQAAGTPLGFLNPILYKSAESATSGVTDIVAHGQAANVRVDYANTTDSVKGLLTSVRTLDYQGPETYCDGAKNCATRNVVISPAKGYDDMTGLGAPGAGFVAALSKF